MEPERGGFGTAGEVGALAGKHGLDSIDVGKAKIAAIEAVGLVDLGDARVTDFGKRDINALASKRLAIYRGSNIKVNTYRVESGSVEGQFDKLDSGIVSGLDAGIRRQRYLGQAHGAWVGISARSDDLEWGDHRVGHVRWTAIGTVGAKP
jgi:hypothetical protein